MLLYLFFDSLLSTWPKKNGTEKWPKAADSPLRTNGFFLPLLSSLTYKTWTSTKRKYFFLVIKILSLSYTPYVTRK